MNKTTISIIIIIIVIVAAYFLFTKSTSNNSVLNTNPQQAVQDSVSSGVSKTNPFNVDVNPYQGYKNPFNK